MNVIAIRQPTGEINLPPEEDGELGTISLKWILAFLVRRWMLIAATATVVFIFCFTSMLVQRPLYSATALVLLHAGNERVLTQDQMVTGGEIQPPTAQVIDSQLEVLRSDMLAGRVVDALGLVNDPEWNKELGPDGQPVSSEPLDPAQVRQDVIDRVSASTTITRRGLTYAAEVTAQSHSSERAAEISNNLVRLFQEYQMESRLESAERANTWLSTRVEELRRDVQDKEATAERFRAQMGLLSTPGGLLTEQQTAELQASVTQARADLAEKEARYAQVLELINNGGSADSIAGVLNSQVISQLRSQEAEIARRQADIEARYGPAHPAVANVRAEREDIRNQITSEITRITASLRNEVEVSRARLNTLQASMAELRGELVGDNEQMVRLRELEREATAARTVYETFLQRVHQIAEQGTMSGAPAQLISEAVAPSVPTSPRLSIAFLLSFALAAGLGLAVGFLAEALDEGFGSAEDVERKTGVTALASIPQIRRREMRELPAASQHPAAFLIERQMSAFTEAFRVLRTTILFAAGQPKTQVVAVTSALPNEGKTTVSLSLARVSALSGQRVLLIDCDLRRRSLKEVLDIEPQVGLLQVLSGEVGWRQALYQDEATGMCVLPVSGSGFTAKEIFGAEDMSRLLAELRNSFDLIIMDCAPVLAVAETRVAVAKADCAVVVTRWQKTPIRAVRTTLQQLHDAGANIRGVALNGVDRRVPGYYSYPTYDFSDAQASR